MSIGCNRLWLTLGLSVLIGASPAVIRLESEAAEPPTSLTSAPGAMATSNQYPDLPEPLTSFGAAICQGTLYVYGGHRGEAHSYSTAEQSPKLFALNLDQPEAWKVAGEGPRLQGLGLVSDGQYLYRVGGFTARNAPGEDEDLWSQDDVARFDPQTGAWEDLPVLPEPRSSHDVVYHDGCLYVIGGWQLRGDQETIWHHSAWRLDLREDNLAWKPLPIPPFQRRALALAAFDGRIYVVGGMQRQGGPTSQVAVYDPNTKTWDEAPALKGKAMAGFGAAAFAIDDTLYASTVDGELQALAEGADQWKVIEQLPTARFFHRMLPWQHDLLIVGGANMEEGKFREIERIEIPKATESVESD